MAHIIRDKQKLLNRLRRIGGQVHAIERAVEEEKDCSIVLQTIAACRGALNGLMAEVVEGHIRHHLVDPDRRPTSDQARAARELIDVVNSYLK
jgi:FrmR/RcnR family transcriptional regulator, repressor of frmRAB operon